jgi:hypothetical protein
MTGPGYDLLVGLHALSAVVGFGAVGISGTYAARARSLAEPRGDDGLRRYFRTGANWAERSLFVTPVLGAIVLGVGDSSAVSQPWPWIGLGCWVLAAGIATGLCWPAERRIQIFFADTSDDGERPAPGLVELREACATLQWGASAVSLCFLVAVVAMIWQPR